MHTVSVSTTCEYSRLWWFTKSKAYVRLFAASTLTACRQQDRSRRQNCRPSDMAIHVMLGVFTNWQATRPIRFKYFNNVPPYVVIFTVISKNPSTTCTCAIQHFHSTRLIGSPKIIHTLNESAEAYDLVAWQQGRESHERRERAFTRS